MQSSPPATKTQFIIPSSPPPLPPSAHKRFLDIEPSSDDIPAFSSDDLPPKEVFADPYQSYRSVRSVKRQKSGTIRTATLQRRAENSFQSSDNPDEDEFPGSNERSSGSTRDSIWSDPHEDEVNTSMTTIVALGSQDDYFDGDSIDELKNEVEKDEAELQANLLIERAIEEGRAIVDLSSLSLKKVPSDIASLSSLIMQPKSELNASTLSTTAKGSTFERSSSGIDPTVSTPFTSLRPELCLYLNMNELTSIPPAVTNLTDTKLLSLRGNQLRDLPFHIGSMTGLRSLTVSHNTLAYLPFEILELRNIERPNGIHTFPNPLFTFSGVDDNLSPPTPPPRDADVLDRNGINKDCFTTRENGKFTLFPDSESPFFCFRDHPKHVFTFITSTPISVFNDLGNLVSPPLTPELSHPSEWKTSERCHSIELPILSTLQAPPSKPYVEGFPSLQELCLRKMATDPMYTGLHKYQREDLYSTLPPHLQRKVADVLEDPHPIKTCTVCERQYITKGAEWIEFWDMFLYSLNERTPPFRTQSFMLPSAQDVLLEAEIENEMLPERTRQDAAMVREVLAASEDGNAFLRSFFGRAVHSPERRQVLPLLREACSWQCAEDWMHGRMQGEAKQLEIMQQIEDEQDRAAAAAA